MIAAVWGRGKDKGEPQTAPLHLYLQPRDPWQVVGDDGEKIAVTGFWPYWDEGFADRLAETDEELPANGIFRFRLHGGTHHVKALQDRRLQLLARVLITPDHSVPDHPHALAVAGYQRAHPRAGYVPDELARSIVGKLPRAGAVGAIIATTTRNGIRVGLDIVASTHATLDIKAPKGIVRLWG